DLRGLRARVGELCGELAVVGEEQGAARVEIEAPHGDDAGAHAAQQLPHGRPALGIRERTDHAARLVEHAVDQRLRDESLPVELDLRRPGIRLGAELGDDLTVYPYPTRQDQLLGLAP